VEFLISANPGEPLKELSRIASGGELSRVMLAIKTVLFGSDLIETLIFDEIDAGIGGEVALAVGEYLAKIAGQSRSSA
jgi:DNA repair protein RecN (Recombination protein N)